MTLIDGIVQNDYGYRINFTLANNDGSTFDLSGNTAVYFRVQKLNSTQLLFSGAMTVVSPTAGTCYYQVAQGNFPLAGVYNAQIQVNFASEIITWPDIQVSVRAALPATA